MSLYFFTTFLGSIKLIDFEYAGVNHIAFDIGNFFNEFAGNLQSVSSVLLSASIVIALCV